jgi:hypothetical protein
MEENNKEFVKKYISAYESLSINNLDTLKNTFTNDIEFEDPFNKVNGKEAVIKIFSEMFEKIDNPKFQILELSYAQNFDKKLTVYLKWILNGKFKRNKKSFAIKGVSEVKFNYQGKVVKHIDYWDSMTQLIIHLPYVGRLVKSFLKSIFKFNNI